jgi:hypothetical protein
MGLDCLFLFRSPHLWLEGAVDIPVDQEAQDGERDDYGYEGVKKRDHFAPSVSLAFLVSVTLINPSSLTIS